MHALVTNDRGAIEGDGGIVRRLLKRWGSEALSERWPLVPGARWWAVGGSVKWVWDEPYFRNVLRYIERQRAG